MSIVMKIRTLDIAFLRARYWFLTYGTPFYSHKFASLVIYCFILRGMCHDPGYYLDPYSFNPGRFLKEHPDPDPFSFAFGYGRRYVDLFNDINIPFNSAWIRVCPGKRLADSSLFISISMILATLNISKAKDERGNVIEPECVYKPGIVRSVSPSHFFWDRQG